MSVLTYRYKLLPTKAQHRALKQILEDQRQLYNAALEERIACYQKTGHTITCYAQQRSLTQCRHTVPGMSAIPQRLQKATLKRLDEAYASFFRRVKAGAIPGFPRFQGKRWFKSFGFAEWEGIRFDGKRIRFKGMPGALRVHLHRPMSDGKILACQFKCGPQGWTVSLQVRAQSVDNRIVVAAIGVDMGLTTLAALSNGHLIANPRIARRAERKMRVRQRAVSRCTKGSARRKKIKALVSQLYAKITNARRTYLHQQSEALAKNYGLIAIEALNVKGLASGMLAKEVADASWGTFIQMLRYKAARAEVQLIEVDPKFTSQTCPECGAIEAKTLKQRVHNCPCGCVLDRDVAAARVILSKAVAGLEGHNVTHTWGERATRNLGTIAETLPGRLCNGTDTLGSTGAGAHLHGHPT